MASVNVDKLSLKELLDLEAKVQKAIAGARGKISAAKYANPDNRAETWTGRGRKPNWLVAKLNKGAKMTDFTI